LFLDFLPEEIMTIQKVEWSNYATSNILHKYCKSKHSLYAK